MSTLKVDTILKRTGTGTITVGQSGDTISIPSGATLTVAGSTITAAGTNTPAFRAYLSSQQSITNGAYTKVIYQAEDFDTDSAYDTSNGRFTVPSGEAGKYIFTVQVQYTSVSDQTAMRHKFYKNGSDYNAVLNFQKTASGTSDNYMQFTNVIDLAAGDYVESYAYQNEGGSRNFEANRNFFIGYKLIT